MLNFPATGFKDHSKTDGADEHQPFQGLLKVVRYVLGFCWKLIKASTYPRRPPTTPPAMRSRSICIHTNTPPPLPSPDAGAMNLGDTIALSGWATVVRGAQSARDWGFTAASYPDGSGSGWAISVGRSAGGLPQEEGLPPPLTLEASCQLPLADGLSLCPGLVAVKHPGCTTAALALRTLWRF